MMDVEEGVGLEAASGNSEVGVSTLFAPMNDETAPGEEEDPSSPSSSNVMDLEPVDSDVSLDVAVTAVTAGAPAAHDAPVAPATIRINGVEMPVLDHEAAKKKGEELLVYKKSVAKDGSELKEPWPVFVDPMALADDLGLGTVFYFRFIESLALIFFIGSLIFGIPGIYINVQSNYVETLIASFDTSSSSSTTATEHYEAISPGSYSRLALGNQSSIDITYIVAHVFFMVILYIMTHVLQSQLKNEAMDIEDENITSGDYTVKLDGLPEDATSPDEIAKYAQRWAKTGAVVSVTISLMTNRTAKIKNELLQDLDELELAQFKLKKLQAEGKDTPSKVAKARAAIDQAIRRKNFNQETLAFRLSWMTKPGAVENTGVAFVVFDRSQDARAMIIDLTPPRYGAFGALVAPARTRKAEDTLFRGKIKLRGSRAPEPTDVNWIHLEVREKQQRINAVSTFFLLLVVSGAALVCLILVFHAQNDAESTASTRSDAAQTVINQGISILISIISKISMFFVHSMSEDIDAHHSHSGRMFNTVLKCFFLEFVNMGLAPFISFLTVPDKGFNSLYWYSKTGFLEQVIANFVSECFVSNASTIMNVAGRAKSAVFVKLAITQKQLDAAYEPPEFDLEEKYGAILYNIFMAVFYCVPLPFCLLVTTLSLVGHYFIDRYMLLRKCKAPPKMDSKIVFETFSYIRVAIFINFVMCALFYWARPASAGNSSSVGTQFGNFVLIFLGSCVGFVLWIKFMIIPLSNCLEGPLFLRDRERKDAADSVPFTSLPNLENYVPPLAQSADDARLPSSMHYTLRQIQQINDRAFVVYKKSVSSEPKAPEKAATA